LTSTQDWGPWNPGIQSPVPAELRHLCTIFRAEHVFTSLEQADELHDLTGIPATELVAFRPRRLALHELLIRITADYAVPDGSRIEDLGINFRRLATRLLQTCIEPAMDRIESDYAQLRARASKPGCSDDPLRRRPCLRGHPNARREYPGRLRESPAEAMETRK